MVAPFPPGDLVVNDLTSNSVRMSWSAPLDGMVPTGYEYSVDYDDPVYLDSALEVSLSLLEANYEYNFRLRSVFDNEVSDWVEVIFTSLNVIDPPSDLIVSDVTHNTAKITWIPPVYGLTPLGYEYSLNYDESILIAPTTELNLSLVFMETQHSIRIRSVADDAYSNWAEAIFTTLPSPEPHVEAPTSPMNVTISVLNHNSVTLIWEPPLGSSVLGYQNSIDGSPYSIPNELTETGFGGLEPETEYSVSIRSINEYGVSDPINVIFTTPIEPPAVQMPPLDLGAANVTGTSADIYWTENFEGAANESFEYSLNGEPSVNVGLNVNVELTGLSPSTENEISVRSLGSAGSSEWVSVIFTTTPGPPTTPMNLLIDSITDRTADASWATGIGGPETLSFEYSLDFSEPISLGLDTSMVILGLDPSTSHTFRIRAVGEFGTSNWIQSDFETYGPSEPPVDLTASSINWDGVTLGWTPPGSESFVTSYEYFLDSDNITDIGLVESIELSSLTALTDYTFNLRAVGLYGVSEWVALEFRTTTGPPNPPRGLFVSNKTSTEITIVWLNPSSGSAVSSYEYKMDEGPILDLGPLESSENRIHVDELEPASTHIFDIRSKNDVGVSNWVQIQVKLNDGLPLPPIDVEIYKVEEREAGVRWLSPETGASISGYEYSLNESPVVTAGLVHQLILGGLEPGLDYSFRLRSSGASGKSDWVEYFFTTLDVPDEPDEVLILNWNDLENRKYELGIDRGVLYLSDNTGVPWQGLTSLEESLGEEGTEPLYFDGNKYFDKSSFSDYSATLRALTYPDEFTDYEGYDRAANGGLISDDQISKPFGITYRTLIGRGSDAEPIDYKIHLIYNLRSQVSDRGHETLSDSINPSEFEWSISSVPIHIPGFRPTAHLIVDTTRSSLYAIMELEAVLYGSEGAPPRLPDLSALRAIFAKIRFISVINQPVVSQLPLTAKGGDVVFSKSDLSAYVYTPIENPAGFLTQRKVFVVDEPEEPFESPKASIPGDLIYNKATGNLFRK